MNEKECPYCEGKGFYKSLYDGWEQRCDCQLGQKSKNRSEWEVVFEGKYERN